jgi:hypothetical protein
MMGVTPSSPGHVNVPSEFVGINVLLIKPMVPEPAADVENTANNPGGPVGSILAE